MQWRSARAWRVATPLLAAMFVASCSQDDLGTGPRIALIRVVAGGNQTAGIGGLLPQPLIAQLIDQRGDPIVGAAVTFEVQTGSGVVTNPVDTTDADGYATTNYRLGPELGLQEVAATLSDLQPAVFAINAVQAPASRLTIVKGDAQSGRVGAQLKDTVTVLASDNFGNARPGVNVNFTVLSGGGALSAATVASDANGLAKVIWTLGNRTGSQAISIASGAIPAVTVTANAIADAPAAILEVSGNNQATNAGGVLSDSIVVRVVDQYGNPVAGSTVDWRISLGGGSTSPTSSVTNGFGRAATQWTLGSNGGPATVTATIVTATDTLRTPFVGAVHIVFESVSAAGRSSCGVDQGGVLYCWGFNGDGQLGLGQDAIGPGPVYTFPQAVTAVTNQTFLSMKGGQYHHCAVTFSHVGYCWGNNYDGQLGINNPVRSAPLPTLVAVANPYAAISAGRSHTCAVTIGGRAHCWGSNERGQLGGNVTIDTVANTVVLVSSLSPKEVGSTTDSKFFGVFDFKAIAAGGVHTCAIQPDGAVRCWGLGREGQLGNGTNSVDEYIPRLVSTGTPMDSITAGFKHSCALSSSGSAFCWGENLDGQLGNGANTNANTPSGVGGGPYKQIAAGYAHTCALSTNGQAFCWGRNDRGQLGDGSVASRNSPVAVLGGHTFRELSAGDLSTCGVTTDNVAYCWGDNEYGALGDGTQVNRSTPTKVRFQP